MEATPTATLNHPKPNGVWTLIIAYILAAILLFLLNSCVTQRQRERILKDCVTSSYRKDSIQTVIRYKPIPYEIHDSIPYYLPNPCADLCDSLGRIKSTFVAQIKGKNGSKLSLKVKDNELIIDDKTISKGVLTHPDTTINHFTTIKDQVHENCKLEHLTKWDSFWIKAGQILSVLIIIIIAFKILKK